MTSPAPQTPVLVVDDEPVVRSVLAAFLQRCGHEVEQATNGEEALQRMEARRFAAMLCDIRMPVMSGTELLPRALAADPDLAIIMLSAIGEPAAAI